MKHSWTLFEHKLFEATSNARLHWLLQRCGFMKSKSTRWTNIEWCSHSHDLQKISFLLVDEWLLQRIRRIQSLKVA